MDAFRELAILLLMCKNIGFRWGREIMKAVRRRMLIYVPFLVSVHKKGFVPKHSWPLVPPLTFPWMLKVTWLVGNFPSSSVNIML